MAHHFVLHQSPTEGRHGVPQRPPGFASASASSQPATSAARCICRARTATSTGPPRVWRLIYHLVNKAAVAKNISIEMVYQYRTTGGEASTPLWLDIDGCSDSEYPAPVGYSDTHADWTSTVTGRMIGIGGHLHDVDVTNSSAVPGPLPGPGARHRGVGRDRRRTVRGLLRPDTAQQPATCRPDRRDAVPLRGLLRHLVGGWRREPVAGPPRHDGLVRHQHRPAPDGAERGVARPAASTRSRATRSRRARWSGCTRSTRTTRGRSRTT